MVAKRQKNIVLIFNMKMISILLAFQICFSLIFTIIVSKVIYLINILCKHFAARRREVESGLGNRPGDPEKNLILNP